MAGHWKLNKLIVLFDDNGISIDGPISLADSVDQVKRFKSAGWAAERIDGHDPKAIAAAIARAQKSDKPTLIACKTTIGYRRAEQGRHREGPWRGARRRRIEGAPRKSSAFRRTPFSVPDDVLKAWRAAGAPRRSGAQGMGATRSRRCRTASAPSSSAACSDERPAGARRRRCARTRRRCCETPQDIATRKASEAGDRGDRAGGAGIGRAAPPISPAPTTPSAKSAWSRSSAKTPRAASSITASASTAWRRP